MRNAHAISSADVPAFLLAEQRADRRRRGFVRRQQAELLQHLDDRPIRDPLPVGEAAAAEDGRLDRSEQLRGETGLAHAGIAGDRDELASLLGPHAFPCLPEDRELALTAYEQLPVPSLRGVEHPQQPVGGNRLGLALQLEGLDRLDVGSVADERERRLTDQYVARLRRLLQPSGDVDRIPGREPLLRPRHDFARHDADPSLQPELG